MTTASSHTNLPGNRKLKMAITTALEVGRGHRNSTCLLSLIGLGDANNPEEIQWRVDSSCIRLDWSGEQRWPVGTRTVFGQQKGATAARVSSQHGAGQGSPRRWIACSLAASGTSAGARVRRWGIAGACGARHCAGKLDQQAAGMELRWPGRKGAEPRKGGAGQLGRAHVMLSVPVLSGRGR
jgi:hypothetical protein